MNANWYTDRPKGALVTSTLYNADHRGHLQNFDRAWATKGLVVMNNASNPGTQLDLYADLVAFRPTNGYNVVRTQVSMTCDTTVAGPIANGRDQAAAFASNSWLHFYFIANLTQGASIVSLTGPTTGPTLPSGYTHWAYVGTYLQESGAMLFLRQVNQRVLYAWGDSDIRQQVLIGGQATAFTTVSLVNVVPPVSRFAVCRWTLSLVHSAVGAAFHAFYRPSVGTVASDGMAIVATVVQTANIIPHRDMFYETWLSATQTFQYRISAVPNVSGGLHIFLLGYDVSN